jgi:hypothetical protein
VEQNYEELEFKETHQLIALTHCTRTQTLLKNNTEALIDACKEDYIEKNVEKAKYTFVSEHYNKGQRHNIKS